MKTNNGDILIGMKAICTYVGVSETTALKYFRELDLPIRKGSRNGDKGIWLSSKTKIDRWTESLVDIKV